jgi:hypothetical protein
MKGIRRALLAALFGCVGGSSVRADLFTLGQAGPADLNLGVFVTGPTTMNASNSGTTFDTNLGLANGASTNFSGGGILHGNLYRDPGAMLQGNFVSQFHIDSGFATITQSLAQAVSDVQNAATTSAAKAANLTLGAIGGAALTIDPTGPLNGTGGHDTVVRVNGNISITNAANNLTIHGGANDFFIINVDGDISVSNGQIKITGGIPTSHVLINLLGTHDVSLSNSSSILNGIYLAPFAGQKISLTPGTVNGAIIGYEINTASGPNVNGPSATPVPAPPAVVFVGLGAGCAALRRYVGRRATA